MLRRLFRTALFAGVSAAFAYFLDPNEGARRRNMLRDQLGARFREGAEQAQQATRAAASEVQGAGQKVAAAAHEEEEPANEQALVAKVETEIFRGEDVPKGQINVDAADGVVTLRGEIGDKRLIERLEKEAAKVTGVREVRNLLHLPGETPPNLEPVASGN